MISTTIVFKNVFLMFLLLIPGFIMRKTKLAGDDLARGFAKTVLYVTQPALIISSFIRPFETEILINAAAVFIFSFVAHLFFFCTSLIFFKKAPADTRKVLRFGTTFSNAAFMGLPLIVAILGNEAAIYVSVYLIWFNIFAWSVGCMIYTGDKKYMSLKKIIINPAVISIIIGIFVFLLPIDKLIPQIVVSALDQMKSTVAPMSMMMVGMRLAEVKWKGSFKDRHMATALILRLMILPACVWAMMKLVSLTGLYSNKMTMAVVLLSSATPVGAVTSMFAEKFNGNAMYASKLVSISTALCLVTMPIVAMLLSI